MRCGCYDRSLSYYWPRSLSTDVLKKYDVFYTSEIPEVMWYEPLYNKNDPSIIKEVQQMWRCRNLRKPRVNLYIYIYIYIYKDQQECIRGQIYKIRNSQEDTQSQLRWQTVNEISKKKIISSAKLKAANQEERVQKWKEHF